MGCHCMELLLDSAHHGWAQPSTLPLESTDGSRYSGEKRSFHSNGASFGHGSSPKGFLLWVCPASACSETLVLGKSWSAKLFPWVPLHHALLHPLARSIDQGPWRAPEIPPD